MTTRFTFICLVVFLYQLSGKSYKLYGQHSAHAIGIKKVFADKRGEVIETQDTGTAKFWSVADGKLLGTIAIKSPEYAIRRLRFMKSMRNPRMEKADGSKEQYVYEFSSDDGSYSKKLKRPDGGTIMSYSFRKGFQGGEDWHQTLGKILLFFTDNDSTRIYMVDPNDASDASGHWKGSLFSTYPGKNAQPVFLQSGKWIVDVKACYIVNVATGNAVAIPQQLKQKYITQRLTFAESNDNASFVFATADGIVTVDAATGKQINVYTVPRKILQDEGYMIYPSGDGKSFVYSGTEWDYDKPALIITRAWLIKEGIALELVD